MTEKTEIDEIAAKLAEKELEEVLKNIGKITEIDELAVKIVSIRKKPLLVLYWHDHDECYISSGNEAIVYKELRKNLDTSFNNIDVLIHTHGGNANTSYLVARAIREFAYNVTFLIPEKATSGGTLIALSGNEIMFGHCARLSSIDYQLDINSDNEARTSTYLKHFLSFTKDVMTTLDEDMKEPTGVEKVMIQEMVKELGTEHIANTYRLNGLSKYYARQCLKYAFPRKEQTDQRDDIVDMLTDDTPSHSAIIDYDVAKSLLLPVTKMPLELSDVTKELIAKLSEASELYEVCELMADEKSRYPFVKYYPALASTEEEKIDGQS